MNDYIEKIKPYTMTSTERCINLANLVHAINKEQIDGDLVECGIWKCGLLGLMRLVDNEYGGTRKVIGFDSFEYQSELPESEKYRVTLSQAKKYLKEMGAQNCILHKGYFHETFPTIGKTIEKISILRIDAGLYDVTKYCLEEFYDKISIGGYIVFDDYGHYEECRKAVNDFREKHNINNEITFTDYTEIWWKKTK